MHKCPYKCHHAWYSVLQYRCYYCRIPEIQVRRRRLSQRSSYLSKILQWVGGSQAMNSELMIPRPMFFPLSPSSKRVPGGAFKTLSGAIVQIQGSGACFVGVGLP